MGLLSTPLDVSAAVVQKAGSFAVPQVFLGRGNSIYSEGGVGPGLRKPFAFKHMDSMDDIPVVAPYTTPRPVQQAPLFLTGMIQCASKDCVRDFGLNPEPFRCQLGEGKC